MTREHIIINEVGPRDGLQSQAKHLSVEQRLQLINALITSGIRHMEVGSFVSPRAVPQMAGTDELLARLQPPQDMCLSVLVPNQKGYELARAAGAKKVAVVVSATETMNQKNINMSLDQVMAVAKEIIQQGAAEGISVQAYLSVAFECPFEGPVAPSIVMGLAHEIIGAGAQEIVVADTIGAANPAAVRVLLDPLTAEHGGETFACHFHDTRAMALANIFAAIESGVRKFDSSIGGLGGCPFAPGAAGNAATEDVVMMCDDMGYDTGINMPELLQAVSLAAELTGTCSGGRAHYWLSENTG